MVKIGPFRIVKNRTLVDWRNWNPSRLANSDPSGLAKLGPFRNGENGTLPDWKIQDPAGLAKLGPFPIGKIWTLPDWQCYDPFRLAKIWTLPDWAKILDPSGLALNRQNLKAVIFSNGRLLHAPSPVLPICLQIAQARPTKILKAIIFPKNPYTILVQCKNPV